MTSTYVHELWKRWSSRPGIGAGIRAPGGCTVSSALAPALVLALFGLWSGTFYGGAGGAAQLVGAATLIVFAVGLGGGVADPLRLGRRGRFLPPALWVATLASLIASPVPRAGTLILATLPLVLLIPAAVERCWSEPARRRRGLLAVVLVAGGVAGLSLVWAWALGSARTALPLGHHNALALFCVFLFPFALLALREQGRWRWVAVCVSMLIVVAVVSSLSLVGSAALVLQLAMQSLDPAARKGPEPSEKDASGLSRGWLRWVLPLLVACSVAGLQWARLTGLVVGVDSSLAARRSYIAAGWEGVSERLLLGWGAGSVPWVSGLHLRPRPGANPPGEVVSSLHFLPLQAAYELGLTGLLLLSAMIALFLSRRRRELAVAEDPGLLWASLTALGPGLLALCLAGFPVLPALPVAIAVAAGAGLAALPGRLRRGPRRWSLAAAALAVVVAAPAGIATLRYEAARVAPSSLADLDAALRFDPGFPLYRARSAWARAAVEPGATEVAEQAIVAAEAAPGVAALWLAAGLLSSDAGLGARSARALERACDLDPLAALAPFYLMMLNPDGEDSPVLGARAVLAEPRLAAATWWRGREELARAAALQIDGWRGVSVDTRRRLASHLASLPVGGGATQRFFLEIDGEPSTSLTLFVFRRSPWPVELGNIELDSAVLQTVVVGSPAFDPSTEALAFPVNGCGAPAEPSPKTSDP